jgi:hypothetical protein
VQDVQEQAEFVSNGAAEVDYVSLAERARERRRQLETRHTTVLEPPGYEGLLAVEYRVITYGDVRKITQRHERIQDDATRELYSAADHLIMASINSWPFDPHTLYTSAERGYLLWLTAVIDRVATERRRQNEQMKKRR